MLRFKHPVLAYPPLLAGLLGAFGVGNYFPALYLGELSGALVVGLFVWMALGTRMRRSDHLVVLLLAFGVASLILLYACVFSARTGAPVAPSVLAQRDYVFFLLGPIVYMLYLRGWDVLEFERIFVLAGFIAMATYVSVYLTVDFEAWVNSGNSYQQGLVTFDEQRGYRLKGPFFIFSFVLLYFGRRLLQSKSIVTLGARLMLVAVSGALLYINAPRSLLVAITVALVLYAVLFSRVRSLTLVLAIFTAVAVLGTIVGSPLNDYVATTLGNDPSYFVRVDTANMAWKYVKEYPLLGFGQDSYQSVSFHDLFDETFYTSDIGVLGVAFQYGILGVCIYLLFGLWIFGAMLKLLWTHADMAGSKQHTFLWALLILGLSFLIVSPLQAPLLYGNGLPVGALCLGFSLAHRHSRWAEARVGSTRRPSSMIHLDSASGETGGGGRS